jgi:site-specific recombinase XerD
MRPTDFANYLSQYLSIYLPGSVGLSTNTIASRRDCFVLLLRYLQDVKKLIPEKIEVPVLTAELITEFLNWLEAERCCSVSTRNLRLSSLKAFFRYLQIQTPDYIYQCQQIAALPMKKQPDYGLDYLSLDCIKALLAIISPDSEAGLRDLTLVSVLYDSAARVQEVADLCIRDVRLNKPATLRLIGKGQKTRIIPIMEPTVRLIESYLRKVHVSASNNNSPLFYNRTGSKLTRAGIAYVLNKYVNVLRTERPDIVPAAVSPHSMRHSKSMHMLSAGVPLIYIRDYLGHVEISTTEVYARADTAQKRQAIEMVSSPVGLSEVPLWQEDPSLMKWLNSLC